MRPDVQKLQLIEQTTKICRDREHVKDSGHDNKMHTNSNNIQILIIPASPPQSHISILAEFEKRLAGEV